MTPVHDELIREFREFARTAKTAASLMEHISQRLHEKMTTYNWVGFYLVDPKDPNMLVVGAYVGSFSPNTNIPLSTGLCGAAATTGRTVVVQDVAADARYLPGSSIVKSEVVVPIFVAGKLAAELDLESYFANTFTKQEQEFAEQVSAIVAEYLGK